MPGGNAFFPHNSDDLREEVAHIKTFLARAFAVRQARTTDPRFAVQNRVSASAGSGNGNGGGGGGSSVLGGDAVGPVPNTQVLQASNNFAVNRVPRVQTDPYTVTTFFDGQHSVHSGGIGWRIDKPDKTQTATPHVVEFWVGGVPCWGTGMDSSTNNALNGGTGDSDYVLAYDYTANAGAGADCLRMSPEAASPDSQTLKVNWGRVVGEASANTHFMTFTGGDNVTGLGGLSVSFWDESATFNAVTLANRSILKKRTLVNFNNQYLWGTDLANANAQNMTLFDSTGLGAVWSVDSAGLITHNFRTALLGSAAVTGTTGATEGIAVTAPAAGRCLTLNAGAGATVFMNPAAGTKRNSVRMASIFQWGTDLANSGNTDFWMQNLGTGNVFLFCDANDRVTLGSTNASGGAVLGVAGGLAGFLGAAPIAKPATYTLAGTAARTLPTIVGQDNTQPGAVYAKVADLQSLEGVVRQILTDLGSTSGYGLLAP